MSFVLAEGTYTSYAIYDSFDDSDINQPSYCTAFVNCLETQAILKTFYADNYIKVYDIDAKTLGSSTLLSPYDIFDWSGWFLKHTFLNTYIAFIEGSTNNLLIYKNGVLLQTLTPAELGLTSEEEHSISFSPRGKYIFITGIRLASSNKGWVVLKGS